MKISRTPAIAPTLIGGGRRACGNNTPQMSDMVRPYHVVMYLPYTRSISVWDPAVMMFDSIDGIGWSR